MTAEDITFSLVGKDEWGNDVGHEAQVEGELIGDQVAVTSLAVPS